MNLTAFFIPENTPKVSKIAGKALNSELPSTNIMNFLSLNLLLKIFLPDKPVPLSAVLKLQWIHIPIEGRMIQRVGGQLLFMDVLEKAHLQQHAYDEILGFAARTDFVSQSAQAFASSPVF